MKTGDMIKAYAAIGPLMETEMTWQESHDLIDLKCRLQAEAKIFSEQERKLIEELADRDESGQIEIKDGKFRISGVKKAERFLQERKEIEAVEVDWNEPKILIHVEKIRPAIYEALEPFIRFV